MKCNAILRFVFLSLSLLCFVACGKNDTVTKVDGDDADMNAAMDRGRATVDEFLKSLKAPGTAKGHSVKAKCVDGEQVEFMWLSNVKFDGGKFTGVIDNEPQLVKNYKLGQKVTIAKDEIADWMYIENREVIGAYTLHDLYKKMSAKEKADFTKSFPYKLPAVPKP